MLINSPSTRGGGLGFAYVSQGGGVSWNAYFCLLNGGGGLKSPQNGLLDINKRSLRRLQQEPRVGSRYACSKINLVCLYFVEVYPK